MDRAYLKLWPDVIPEDKIILLARIIVNAGGNAKEFPELYGVLIDPVKNPTVRNVIAQLMNYEIRGLEKLLADDAELSALLDSREKKEAEEGFIEGYMNIAYEVLAADFEVYRRKMGISPEEMAGRGFYLYKTFAEENEAYMAAQGDLLEKHPDGENLVRGLFAADISPEALSFMGARGNNGSLLDLLAGSFTKDFAASVGMLCAHKRYANLVQIVTSRIPELQLEYQKTDK